jgi:hypothetical protein
MCCRTAVGGQVVGHLGNRGPLPGQRQKAGRPAWSVGPRLGRPAIKLTGGGAGGACEWHRLVVGGRPYRLRSH